MVFEVCDSPRACLDSYFPQPGVKHDVYNGNSINGSSSAYARKSSDSSSKRMFLSPARSAMLALLALLCTTGVTEAFLSAKPSSFLPYAKTKGAQRFSRRAQSSLDMVTSVAPPTKRTASGDSSSGAGAGERNQNIKLGILLLNLGGPSKMDDVEVLPSIA